MGGCVCPLPRRVIIDRRRRRRRGASQSGETWSWWTLKSTSLIFLLASSFRAPPLRLPSLLLLLLNPSIFAAVFVRTTVRWWWRMGDVESLDIIDKVFCVSRVSSPHLLKASTPPPPPLLRVCLQSRVIGLRQPPPPPPLRRYLKWPRRPYCNSSIQLSLSFVLLFYLSSPQRKHFLFERTIELLDETQQRDLTWVVSSIAMPLWRLPLLFAAVLCEARQLQLLSLFLCPTMRRMRLLISH